MFKLLSAILVFVVLSYADPEPFTSNTIQSSSGKSLQTAAAAASLTSSNAVTSDEEADNAANEDVSSDAAKKSATSSATRSAQLIASSAPKSVSGIEHHILPAEAIPLPISIATRPGIRTVIAPETITIHEPAIAKVGEVVQKIPTAVSHQSQTIVHKHARLVTPIVAPALRTITSRVVHAYHTPLVYESQSPLLRVVNN